MTMNDFQLTIDNSRELISLEKEALEPLSNLNLNTYDQETVVPLFKI